MKKILFALLLAIGTTTLFAQDIIITKESVRIDAKILEITDYEVKYLQYGDSDEEILDIKIPEIASILFENGETYFPNNGTDIIDSQYEDKQIQDTTFTPIPITLKTGRTIMFEQGKTLVGIYYGEYDKLKYRELGDFLEQTCSEAYNEFKKANRCVGFGSGLLLIGAGVATYGHVLTGMAETYKSKLGGYVLAILGWCIVEVSFDLYIVALDASIKTSEVFNKNCGSPKPNRSQTSLSLSLSPTSVGLTFKF